MEGFKTPTAKRNRPRIAGNSESNSTPLKIPPTPFLQQIGYGSGVNVFILERSPKVGFTRSPWAIKKRNQNVSKHPRYNAQIQMEAKILGKLKHPNIVGFRGLTYSESGDPCLAMEKLDISLGDEIERRVEEGEMQFPADSILKVGFELAKGLEYLHHEAHILHGDVKSYNVLISKDLSVVKLCDFGVSLPLTKDLEMDYSTGNVYTGTECWNAPEIQTDEGPVTNKTDMWAYGLVLWEMIALSPPSVDEEEDMSLTDSMLDGSYLEDHSMVEKENDSQNSDLDDSNLSILKDPKSKKYRTRPPLPAIDLGPEYGKVLEIFYACTVEDYRTRPSAKGVVMFFKNYVKLEESEKK